MGWMATIWTLQPVCQPDRFIFSWGLKQIAHKYSLSDSLTAQTMREREGERQGERGERESEGERETERGRGGNGEGERERGREKSDGIEYINRIHCSSLHSSVCFYCPQPKPYGAYSSCPFSGSLSCPLSVSTAPHYNMSSSPTNQCRERQPGS
jgi:hypothetical protein